jgi:peptidoglycan L-alanyl-D-glutamate endopeptidase CwlK
MPTFGTTSRARLDTCHPKLQLIFNHVVHNYDCTVLCGHRDKRNQDLVFKAGRSTVSWPSSKHNSFPSKAIDIAPYPINWGEKGTPKDRQKALARFYHFAGYVKATAEDLGIRLRWGGDWDSDLEFKDQSFDDLPHFELLE